MLTIEDGTGLANADAYVSVADVDARCSSRGLTLWAELAQSDKEAAIRRATDYMEQTYRGRWTGKRRSREQALSWPRVGVVVDGFVIGGNEIPVEVANACSELAFRGAFRELSKDAGTTQEKQSVKVGPIETTYVAGSALKARYTAVDEMLRPLISSGGMSVRLVRA